MYEPIGVVSLHRHNRTLETLNPFGIAINLRPKDTGEQWAVDMNQTGSHGFRKNTHRECTTPIGSNPFIITIAINIESLRDCY